MTAIYNEIDEAACAMLNEQIRRNVIAPGAVEPRSIKDLKPDDLRGFTQVHLFAGGGLWSVAARLARWPDDRPLWTASCPCQPFSAAGKGLGTDDPRHLWPDVFRLVRACRPPVLVGEQVAGASGYGWFDGVRADLEGEGYACRAVDIPACAIDAPHQRNRLYWVAVADSTGATERGYCGNARGASSEGQGQAWSAIGDPTEHSNGARREGNSHNGACSLANSERGERDGRSGLALGRPGGRDAVVGPHADDRSGDLEHAAGERRGEGRAEHELRRGRGAVAGADAQGGVAYAGSLGREEAFGSSRNSFAPDRQRATDCVERLCRADGLGKSYWSDHVWIAGHDGKARRAKPGLRLLADGIPGRVDLWRVGGNAIVPQLAAEVLVALLETLDERPFIA